MAESAGKLRQRVISAFAAAIAALSIGIYFQANGIYLLCAIAIGAGQFEFSRMTFRRWAMPVGVKLSYAAAVAAFFALALYAPAFGLVGFALANILFLSGSLWSTRDRVSNENLLAALAVGLFGLSYSGLFPYFCLRLVALPDGPKWFLFLLLVVFAGDTFAYFGGRFFGRRKIMPRISPNKTVVGSISGLFGSALVGTADLIFIGPDAPWIKTVLFCLSAGLVAQSGDLLISLLKRVADVKDSGALMPGHGGMLDRMDGIFIACPLVYVFATYVV